jgi:hypothetical protein
VFDKLRNLFIHKPTTTLVAANDPCDEIEVNFDLVCPRCEESLEGHDEGACARRMSRRYFFGVVGGGLVAAAAAPKIADLSGWTVEIETGPSLLTTKEITYAILEVLHDNFKAGRKIGDTLAIRRPPYFRGGTIMTPR